MQFFLVRDRNLKHCLYLWKNPVLAGANHDTAMLGSSLSDSRLALNFPRAARPRGFLFAFRSFRSLNATNESSFGTVMWNLLKEFLFYLRAEKKWWLIPLVVMLIGFGAVLIFGSSSGLGWAIYPFM